ncbi:hypothetical protein SRHO_G00048630 [Serrasalmus rhombeus]
MQGAHMDGQVNHAMRGKTHHGMSWYYLLGWRDVDRRAPRLHSLQEALDQILEQIKEAHQQCTCHDQCKAPPNVRKHSVSKSLRHLFQPTSKFIKNLKR